jgi:hypothetical protein
MESKSKKVASCLLIELCAALVLVVGVSAEEPMLRPGEWITANAQPLKVEAQAIPCVCDWDNDGSKDLLVGYRYADKVALFLNEGTDANPAFGTFQNLQAAGADILHPGSGCGAPAPWVCDYDADGRKDLLVGTSDGYVYFYRNTNTDESPVLAAGVLLTVGGGALNVGSRATPYVHDWDEDGLNDLLCGDGNGNVRFFKNIGTPVAPVYAGDVLIRANEVAVDFGSRSAIRVLDWDGDGVKDLLGSASNNASWCKNVGTNAAPVLEAPLGLQAPEEGIGLANIDTGYRMRLEVIDWNNDGVLDLLIGADDGYVFYYEGYPFAVCSIQKAGKYEIIIEWNSAAYLTYDLLAGETLDSLFPIAARLPSSGDMTMWSDIPSSNIQFYRVRLAE